MTIPAQQNVELDQLKNQVKQLTAQIAATNQLYSESIQVSINLKTNAILFQQMIQECNQKITELTKDVADKQAAVDAKQAEIDKMLAPAPIPATQPEGEADSAAA